MDIMKCIITGPADTPYENGCFVFDIYMPQDYPVVPPNVNLETNGNQSIRFNPNLYENGKVCLSLLGTWRGGPNEQWNENTSTLEQVLVSIQSLILVEKPYFNEPSYEATINTPEGERESVLYNETIKNGTLQWAIIEQLIHPAEGFEEIILKHFTRKRQSIMDQCVKWLEIANESESHGHFDKMMNLCKQLYNLLVKLDPNVPLNFEYTAKLSQEEEKTIQQRTELAQQLMEIVPGFEFSFYVEALAQKDNDMNLAIDYLYSNTW